MELANLNEALQKVKKTHSEEELKKLTNIPDNQVILLVFYSNPAKAKNGHHYNSSLQVVLIKECFAAGKLKNPKGMRYTDEWLLLCLLMFTQLRITCCNVTRYIYL